MGRSKTKNYSYEQKIKDRLITLLYELKKINPNQEIIIETSGKLIRCKLKDALIYEGVKREIIIDSEPILNDKRNKD